jgi:hypothetical protein
MHCGGDRVSDKTVAKSLRRFRIDERLGPVDDTLGLKATDCCGQDPPD